MKTRLFFITSGNKICNSAQIEINLYFILYLVMKIERTPIVNRFWDIVSQNSYCGIRNCPVLYAQGNHNVFSDTTCVGIGQKQRLLAACCYVGHTDCHDGQASYSAKSVYHGPAQAEGGQTGSGPQLQKGALAPVCPEAKCESVVCDVGMGCFQRRHWHFLPLRHPEGGRHVHDFNYLFPVRPHLHPVLLPVPEPHYAQQMLRKLPHLRLGPLYDVHTYAVCEAFLQLDAFLAGLDCPYQMGNCICPASGTFLAGIQQELTLFQL